MKINDITHIVGITDNNSQSQQKANFRTLKAIESVE